MYLPVMRVPHMLIIRTGEQDRARVNKTFLLMYGHLTDVQNTIDLCYYIVFLIPKTQNTDLCLGENHPQQRKSCKTISFLKQRPNYDIVLYMIKIVKRKY